MYTIDTLEPVDLDDIGATDLHEIGTQAIIIEPIEYQNHILEPSGTLMGAYKITIGSDEDQYYRHPERAEAIVTYVDGDYRLGVAWGADATWGSVHTDAKSNDDPAFNAAVLDALNDWLTDVDAWEARN